VFKIVDDGIMKNQNIKTFDEGNIDSELTGSVFVGDRVVVIGGCGQIRGCLGTVMGTHLIYPDYYKVSIDGSRDLSWCCGRDLLKLNNKISGCEPTDSNKH